MFLEINLNVRNIGDTDEYFTFKISPIHFNKIQDIFDFKTCFEEDSVKMTCAIDTFEIGDKKAIIYTNILIIDVIINIQSHFFIETNFKIIESILNKMFLEEKNFRYDRKYSDEIGFNNKLVFHLTTLMINLDKNINFSKNFWEKFSGIKYIGFYDNLREKSKDEINNLNGTIYFMYSILSSIYKEDLSEKGRKHFSFLNLIKDSYEAAKTFNRYVSS